VVPAHFLVVAVSAADGDEFNSMWGQFSPIKDSGAPTIALVLGVFGWFPLNLLIPYKTGLTRFHRLGNSDAMDRFLFDSAESNALIQVTLSDGKFYVGKVDSIAANPLAPNSFIQILPYASGYRDKDTKELSFTSFYDTVYDEMVREPGFTEDALDQFKKVLPFSAIFSANRFDPEMYMRFQRETASDPAAAENEVGEGSFVGIAGRRRLKCAFETGRVTEAVAKCDRFPQASRSAFSANSTHLSTPARQSRCSPPKWR
jgi:hypothetical protein